MNNAKLQRIRDSLEITASERRIRITKIFLSQDIHMKRIAIENATTYEAVFKDIRETIERGHKYFCAHQSSIPSLGNVEIPFGFDPTSTKSFSNNKKFCRVLLAAYEKYIEDKKSGLKESLE